MDERHTKISKLLSYVLRHRPPEALYRETATPHRLSLVSLALGEAAYVALFAFLLFLPAGTLRWSRAWVLLAVLTAVRAVGLLRVSRRNPGLLAERSRLPLHKGQPLADKLLLPAFMASFAGLVAFASFDVFRLRVLGRPSAGVSAAGLLAFAAGWVLVMEALRSNAFAATVVRYQDERRHRVVDGGVYRFVRHPMYAGLIPVLVGMCLWLGSTAGAVLASVPIGILVVRIVLEERVLERHLQGYEAYRAKVRSRLVPGLW